MSQSAETANEPVFDLDRDAEIERLSLQTYPGAVGHAEARLGFLLQEVQQTPIPHMVEPSKLGVRALFTGTLVYAVTKDALLAGATSMTLASLSARRFHRVQFLRKRHEAKQSMLLGAMTMLRLRNGGMDDFGPEGAYSE